MDRNTNYHAGRRSERGYESMIIKGISINGKDLQFKKNNLIYSKKNSSGKTTFIRLLLFSIGWNVPSTKHFDFRLAETDLFFERGGRDYKFHREKNNITVYMDENFLGKFDTKYELDSILSIYSSIVQPKIIENFLGTVYFDQEKGWTLLNRGKVIGSIGFSIEEYIEGLNGLNQSNLREKIKQNNSDIKGYQLLRKTMEFQEVFSAKSENLDWTLFDELNADHRSNEIAISAIDEQISSLEKAKASNDNFIKMVDNFGIRIRTTSGGIETVSKKNIDGFNDTQSMIDARIAMLQRENESLLSKKAELEIQLDKQSALFSLNSQLDRFNENVKKMNIDLQNIESIIESIRNENKKIKDVLREAIRDTDYAKELFELIVKFAKELEIVDYLDMKSDFIYTNDLKKYSGAVLHLLVFAFRMAYLHLLQEQTNEYFPIILDSPFGNEVKAENVQLMYDLLEHNFPNNQVITASVEDISEFSIIDNKLEFEGNMLDSMN